MPAPTFSLSSLLSRPRGKHARRSRTVPVLLAGGMTAAFVVLDGAALPGAASAGGSTAQFERLASCESGGNWSINTGNGYYGGLQFDVATWRGLGYGGYPHQASKATQIAAGQKLQGQRGWSPWPACSRKLGLSGGRSSGSGEVAATPTKPAKATPSTAKPAKAKAVKPVKVKAAKVRAAKAAKAAKVKVKVRVATTSKTTTATPAKTRTQARPTGRTRTTPAPAFDGHVLTAADVRTYRASATMWQQRMADRGWKITVDGHFGPQSAAVAKAFLADRRAQPGTPRLTTAAGTVDAQLWRVAWTSKVTP